MTKTFQVNELFKSLQGEGKYTGIPATFIRLQGCTVGCPWCDSGPLADEIKGRTNGMTRNTWGRGGERMTSADIVGRVLDYRVNHVIITGGEPTLYDLDALIDPLQDMGYYVQLETSGQQWLKGRAMPDWITWSPKEMLGFDGPRPFYIHASEVKFVVDQALTLSVVEGWLDRWVHIREEVMGFNHRPIVRPEIVFMPEGCPPSEGAMEKASKMVEFFSARWPLIFRFGDRLQYRLGIR